MTEFFIFYTESNLVCVIIFGIMLAHDLFNIDRQEKQVKYDQALISFMLYFVSDSVWAAIMAGVLPLNRFTAVAVDFANYILMATLTYMWLEYVMAVEQVRHRNRKINKFAVIFPFLVSTIALVVTYLVSPDLLLDSDLQVTPVFNIFLVAVPYINIAAVIIYTMRRAKHEENPIEKKRHLYIGLFPLMVIAGGLVQIIFLPNTPIFCFCCTILMLMLYIQSMETQISIDPLTKLNNRGQLIRYVSQKNNLYREDRPTFVIMMDVNGFKAINDTFGHAEGDKALIIIASALKETVKCRSMPVFLGRYGGDEFILIVHPDSEEELPPLIREIRERIVSLCSAEERPYTLSIGAGYDELINELDTFQKCIQRADHKLYLDKEYCKMHGSTTVCR